MPVPGEAGSPRTFQLARQLAARHPSTSSWSRRAPPRNRPCWRATGAESPSAACRSRRSSGMREPTWRRLAQCAAGRPLVRHPAPPARGARGRAAGRGRSRQGRRRDLGGPPADGAVRGGNGAAARRGRGRLHESPGRRRGTTCARLVGSPPGSVARVAVRRYERRTLRAAAAVVLISPVEADAAGA